MSRSHELMNTIARAEPIATAPALYMRGLWGHSLDVDGDAGGAVLLDRGEDAEGEVDVVGDAVAHQLELAIGGDERDGAVGVEAT